MSKYTDMAEALRRQGKAGEGRHLNCAQTVVAVFARDAGFDEDTALNAAACFGGGMRMGSVCGAITGALMVLGLAGADDPAAVTELYRALRGAHEGMVNCKDLLRASAQKGEDKFEHCTGMICECVGIVETILRDRGRLN